MPVQPKPPSRTSTASVSAQRPGAKPEPGLTPQQRTSYANRLITADLQVEKAKAQALRKEAAGEPASARAASLLAAADDRLALIAAEQKDRAALAAAKLSDGTTGAALAKTLRTAADADLLKLGNDLRSALSSKKPPADAAPRLLAVTREQGRRAAAAEATRARAETSRLEQTKKDYSRTLSGKTDAQLAGEQKAEHGRLAEAQDVLAEARAALETATPSGRPAAIKAVNAAERAVRTEYARAAVIDSLAPVRLDHKALHDYADALKTRTVPQLQKERQRVAAELAGFTSGALRGSRVAVATDKVKVAILDAAIARAQKTGGTTPVTPVRSVDPTRNPGNVVFDGPGMFVADASAYPAALYAQRLKAAGVTWVSIQVNNPGPVGGNLTALQNGWAEQWRQAGFKVGFWGVSYGKDTASDARTAAQLTAQYKGDFYIADCEGPFQAGEGDPARNREFVNAFQDEATKQGIGKVPRALSSMGRVALDMKPWIDNGWDAMPQAYWNDFEVYQPSKCVQFYEDWGWPKDRIHPTIGTYTATGDQKSPKEIRDYVADLKAGGTTGFSYYLPEAYLDDNEYQQLVAGIAGGMNGPAKR